MSGVGDGTNIIIMCLPDASGELLLIFLRERWGGDVATNAIIPVFGIDIDTDVSACAGIWRW